MACDCETYVCLSTVPDFSDCPDTIELVLEATETATWIWEWEFNGKWFGGYIDVTNGENIELPFVFNENYIHQIKFTKADGTLFNDTCYKLDTSTIAGNYTAASSGTSSEYIIEVTIAADGSAFTSSLIASRTVMVIITNGTSKIRTADFTQSSNTITFVNGDTVVIGQKATLILAY